MPRNTCGIKIRAHELHVHYREHFLLQRRVSTYTLQRTAELHTHCRNVHTHCREQFLTAYTLQRTVSDCIHAAAGSFCIYDVWNNFYHIPLQTIPVAVWTWQPSAYPPPSDPTSPPTHTTLRAAGYLSWVVIQSQIIGSIRT